jgi:hypothetical protein
LGLIWCKILCQAQKCVFYKVPIQSNESPKTEFVGHEIFISRVTIHRSEFLCWAQKSIHYGVWNTTVILMLWIESLHKNWKKYLEAPKSKIPLNSRWPPKFDLLLKSTKRLFYKTFFRLVFGIFFKKFSHSSETSKCLHFCILSKRKKKIVVSKKKINMAVKSKMASKTKFACKNYKSVKKKKKK